VGCLALAQGRSAVKGFHLLVWENGEARVFGEVKGDHTFGQQHWPEFNGRFSLWLLVRLWWKVRR